MSSNSERNSIIDYRHAILTSYYFLSNQSRYGMKLPMRSNSKLWMPDSRHLRSMNGRHQKTMLVRKEIYLKMRTLRMMRALDLTSRWREGGCCRIMLATRVSCYLSSKQLRVIQMAGSKGGIQAPTRITARGWECFATTARNKSLQST